MWLNNLDDAIKVGKEGQFAFYTCGTFLDHQCLIQWLVPLPCFWLSRPRHWHNLCRLVFLLRWHRHAVQRAPMSSASRSTLLYCHIISSATGLSTSPSPLGRPVSLTTLHSVWSTRQTSWSSMRLALSSCSEIRQHTTLCLRSLRLFTRPQSTCPV